MKDISRTYGKGARQSDQHNHTNRRKRQPQGYNILAHLHMKAGRLDMALYEHVKCLLEYITLSSKILNDTQIDSSCQLVIDNNHDNIEDKSNSMTLFVAITFSAIYIS